MKNLRVMKTLLLLLLTVFLCTGCIRADLNMKLNKSGKLKLSYLIGFDDAFVKEAGSNKADLYKQLDDLKNQMESDGFKAKKYEDDNLTGYKFTTTYKNVFRDGGFSDNYMSHSINRERGFFFTKYSWQGKFLPSNVMFSEGSNVTIEMPVKVKTTNADMVSENRKKLQWNLISGRANEINIETTAFNTGKIVTLLILLVLFGFYASSFLKKQTAPTSTSNSTENKTEEQ